LQSGGRSGAGAEQPNGQFVSFGLLLEPLDRACEPIRKQPNVEPELPGELVNRVFVAREKVHQQGSQTGALQDFRNVPIAGRVTG
jgi:hypothetical protein